MACAKNSDKDEILKVLKEMSVENDMGALTRHPATGAQTLGSDVSLVRDVVVPIIAFTCLLLFRSPILFLHAVSGRKRR